MDNTEQKNIEDNKNNTSIQKMSFSEGVSYILQKAGEYIEKRKELLAQKVEANQKMLESEIAERQRIIDAEKEAAEVQRKKDIAIYEQQELANFLLNNNKFYDYFTMLNNGYIPTLKQYQFCSKQIDKIIYSSTDNRSPCWIASSPDYKAAPVEVKKFEDDSLKGREAFENLSILIKNNIRPTNEQYIELLFTRNVLELKKFIDEHIENPNDIFKDGNNIKFKKHNHFLEHFLGRVQHDDFSNALFDRFNEILYASTDLKSGNYSDKYVCANINRLYFSIEVLKIMPEILFKNVSMEKYTTLFNSWSDKIWVDKNSSINHFKDTFANILDTYYAKEFAEKLNPQQKPVKKTP